MNGKKEDKSKATGLHLDKKNNWKQNWEQKPDDKGYRSEDRKHIPHLKV